MFSTFSRFSANNIDRINRQTKEDDREFKEKIAKFTTDLESLETLSNKQRSLDSREQENKKRNKSFLSKVLGDTNQMIFGAMVFAFLIIATIAVVGAGPLAVAAMGTFAAGVGGAVVAKAVKKFRNMGKSKGNYAPIMSQGIESMGKLLQKQMNKDLGVEDQEVAKKSGKSISDTLSSLFGGKKADAGIQMSEEIKKQLEEQIKEMRKDTIKEKEDALQSDITELQRKFYANLIKVMGKDNYCKSKDHDHGPIEPTSDILNKLLKEEGFNKSSSSEEVNNLRSIMKGYDQKGLTEKKLVLKTLNDIFDKCDDKVGSDEEKDKAGKKKTELAHIIKGTSSSEPAEKDKVGKLITDKKEEFDDKSPSKKQKDQARDKKNQALMSQ